MIGTTNYERFQWPLNHSFTSTEITLFATLFLANDWNEAHYSDEKVENLCPRGPVSLESINPI